MSAWGLVLLIAGCSALAAQTGDVTDTVYVRLGLVDAIVLDDAGRPLRDLTAEDFELVVNGRVVPIAHFEAPEPGSARQGATPDAAGGPTARGVPPRVGGRNEDSAGASTVFVYFDDANTPAPHRARVQGDLVDALLDAGVDRRVVVVQRLDRLEFSPRLDGAEAIRAHVASLAKPPARSLVRSIARERATTELAKTHEDCLAQIGCEPCDTNWGQLLSQAHAYAVEEESRTADAVAALAEIAAVAAGVEGQKILLWVSSGVSQRPGIEAFDYVGNLCEAYRSDARSATMRELLAYDESARLQRLAMHANARRVTVVALDAGGLRAGLSSSVSFASAAVRPTTENDSVFASNLQSALSLLATETGGRAVVNANRPREPLGGVLAQVTDGYVLGFSLEGPPTGREHLVTVRLVGRRLRNARVRYRRSLRDRVVDEALLDGLAATLYLGETENPLRASVADADQVDIGRRFQEVAVEIAVPKAVLTELAGADARVRVWLTAGSESGWRSKTRQELFDPREEAGDLLRVAVRMELPEEPVRVAVGVREETTGVTSRLLLELTPGEATGH